MAVEGPVAGRQSGAGFSEQFPRHRHLGQLERDIATMADNLGADLDQLLPQSQQCPKRVQAVL